MKVVAGSYERFVWGWDAEEELAPCFSMAAHLSPVKCAAAWGADCATGGADDTIHVFDLRSSSNYARSLQSHKGAVTCLQFFSADSASPKATHLFSGSEDGTISIWDADSWIHLKSMKGKAPIADMSVHASGKLALSVEKHCGFRMWNLMKGRCSFRTKLAHEASLVQFNEDGDSYALVCGNSVTVHNAEDSELLHKLEHDKSVLCFQIQDKLLLTGDEGGGIQAWDLRSGSLSYTIAHAHSKRVKGVTCFKPAFNISSVSSDGLLKVWDTRKISSSPVVPLAAADTKARLTCVVSSSVPRETLRVQTPADVLAAPQANGNGVGSDEGKTKRKSEQEAVRSSKQRKVLS